MTYSTMSAIALVLSIIATVLGIIFFIPKKNREKMGGFGKKVHDFVNFKVLFVDYVLKGFYIFTTVFTFIAGFLTMFTLKTTYRSVYDSTSIMTKTEPTTSFSIENVITGFLIMILGPIIVRIVYELIMLAVIGVRNVIEINKKMDGCEEEKPEEPIKTTPAEPTMPEKIVEAAEDSSEL